MDNFSLVKGAVSAVDVWAAYGSAPIKKGFVRCIYHNDKKPSMRLYEGNRGFYCFSCQSGGDAIKLAGDLLNLPPVAALKRLNADFHIGLDLDKPPDPGAVHRAQERKHAIEFFEGWLDNAYMTLAAYHRLLWQAKKEVPNLIEEFSSLQIEALQELSTVSYCLDCLEDDPMGVYKSSRRYISKIAQRLEGMKINGEVFG